MRLWCWVIRICHTFIRLWFRSRNEKHYIFLQKNHSNSEQFSYMENLISRKQRIAKLVFFPFAQSRGSQFPMAHMYLHGVVLTERNVCRGLHIRNLIYNGKVMSGLSRTCERTSEYNKNNLNFSVYCRAIRYVTKCLRRMPKRLRHCRLLLNVRTQFHRFRQNHPRTRKLECIHVFAYILRSSYGCVWHSVPVTAAAESSWYDCLCLCLMK